MSQPLEKGLTVVSSAIPLGSPAYGQNHDGATQANGANTGGKPLEDEASNPLAKEKAPVTSVKEAVAGIETEKRQEV